MKKEDIDKILQEADNILGNYSDAQLKGFATLSKRIKGNNNPIHKMQKNPFTDKQFIKINTERNRNRIVSTETKLAISKKAKGRKLTDETKRKISVANKGKFVSKETREKMSASNKGKFVSKETREKISEANKGKTNQTLSKNNSKLNSEIYYCMYCNRDIGGFANYKRFHSDNCKMKK
jgi:hypothetical protein